MIFRKPKSGTRSRYISTEAMNCNISMDPYESLKKTSPTPVPILPLFISYRPARYLRQRSLTKSVSFETESKRLNYKRKRPRIIPWFYFFKVRTARKDIEKRACLRILQAIINEKNYGTNRRPTQWGKYQLRLPSRSRIGRVILDPWRVRIGAFRHFGQCGYWVCSH